MASTRLTRTVQSGGNRAKWTWSAWVKRAKLGATQTLFAAHADSNNKTRLEIAADDELYFNDESGGNTNGRIVSTQKFRDTFGWMHIVAVWDKDNSTGDDRILYYVNGTRITSFSDTGNAPSGDSTMNNSSVTHEIGSENSGNYFSGYMSHIHFCDGYAYAASDFGEADSNGVWKIKTSPSVSYGTTGYFILKNGNSVTDQSGNSNNWTVAAGNLTNDKDNPSDVFATMNNLDALFPTHATSSSFANCNTEIQTGTGSSSSNGYSYNNATIAVSTGKFYWEIKPTNVGGSSFIGIISESQIYNQNLSEITNSNAYAWTIRNSNGNVRNNNSNITYAASYTANDIIGVALDLDNNKLYFSKNGVWADGSGAWGSSTFDAAVGAITITAAASTESGFYFPTVGASDYATASTFQTNFGNGRFGTNAISSAGTNASNNGVFEYDVPANFTALCTKGLNS